MSTRTRRESSEVNGERMKKIRRIVPVEEEYDDDDDDDDFEPVSQLLQEGAETDDDSDENMDEAVAHTMTSTGLKGKRSQSLYDLSESSQLSKKRKIDDEEEEYEWQRKNSTAGWIDKIILEHFMCHQYLSLDFCRHINFINGANGSGKSAIIAALQVCLGVRADQTHRAHRIGDLVRAGHSGRAKVQIYLYNEGPDSFEPKVWGRRIIIEKSWTKNKSSTILNLRDASGEIKLTGALATTKLNNILEDFKICVENPVAVLDQENAKKFIRGKAEDKYKFFLKATEINDIADKIWKAKKDVALVLSDAKRQESQLESYHQAWLNEKKKLQDLESLYTYQKQITLLRAIKPFVLVERAQVSIQKALKAYEEKAKIERDTIEKLEEAKNELETRYTTRNNKKNHDQQTKPSELDIVEAELKELKNETQVCTTSRNDLEQRMQQATKKTNALNRDVARAEKNLKQLEKERTKINLELEKISQRNKLRMQEYEKNAADENSFQAQLAALNKERQQAERIYLEAKATAVETDKLFEKLKSDLTKLKKAQYEALLSEERAKSLLRDHEHELEQVNAQVSGGRAVCFGWYQSKIKAQVERRIKEFKVCPIGPLGAYIQLDNTQKDNTRWLPALEAALGGNKLQSWLVANGDDKDLLLEIFKSLKIDAPFQVILQRQSSRYSEIRDLCRIHAGYVKETILSVLEIENDWVFNTFIDIYFIDTIVLSETKKKAENGPIELQEDGSYKLRTHISKIHLLNGDETGSRNGSLYYRKFGSRTSNYGALSTALGGTSSATERLGAIEKLLSKFKQDVSQAQNKVLQAKSELAELSNKFLFAKEQNRRAQKQVDETETQWRNADTKYKSCLTEAEEKQDTLELEDETELNEELRKQDDEIDQAQNELNQAKNQVDIYDTNEIQKLRTEKRKTIKRNNQLQKELEEKEQQLRDLLETQQLKKIEVNRLEKKAKKAQEEVQNAQKLLDAEHARKASLTALAYVNLKKLNLDEPNPQDIIKFKSEEAVQAKIDANKKLFNEATKSAALDETDLDVMRKRVNNVEIAYKEKSAGSARCKEEAKVQQADIKERLRLLRRIHKAICRKTNLEFNKVLNTKGASGDLVFDHFNERLGIIYQRDAFDDSNRITSIANLSGGERSFATLSMLIAIGHCIESPFRIMDEFDIFMDQFSRKIAMEQLIEIANTMLDKQFIFITPQDLGSLSRTSNLKIIRLQRPHSSGQQRIQPSFFSRRSLPAADTD